MGRYTSEARHWRTCRLCNSANAKEDEQHTLLHRLQLDDLRDLLQTSGQVLTDPFNKHPPVLLAEYVRAALLQHQSVLPLS